MTHRAPPVGGARWSQFGSLVIQPTAQAMTAAAKIAITAPSVSVRANSSPTASRSKSPAMPSAALSARRFVWVLRLDAIFRVPWSGLEKWSLENGLAVAEAELAEEEETSGGRLLAEERAGAGEGAAAEGRSSMEPRAEAGNRPIHRPCICDGAMSGASCQAPCGKDGPCAAPSLPAADIPSSELRNHAHRSHRDRAGGAALC